MTYRCAPFTALLLLGLLALMLPLSPAIAQADPQARAAVLSHVEGSVVFAPQGATVWTDAVRNRPVTRGDRIWTDDGARAELHLGSAALHLDSRTFAEVIALDGDALQVRLNEGAVNARVRQLAGGENFEIDTPQLAFRAAQPGDFRIDVDAARGFTRITVRSGGAIVHGAGGGVMQLQPGQSLAFAGRDLQAAQGVPGVVQDVFDRWAADRNRAEDQSIAARYVPREIVGYTQLDDNGAWMQDATYGAVWYPRVAVADWAPYRYGRWEWVVPWGWTWIDDAPWGFAPYHYGRWAQIGPRWAWVPGRMGPRPVYSHAPVGFVGRTTHQPHWNRVNRVNRADAAPAQVMTLPQTRRWPPPARIALAPATSQPPPQVVAPPVMQAAPHPRGEARGWRDAPRPQRDERAGWRQERRMGDEGGRGQDRGRRHTFN
jgi:hypothetical protein